MPGLVQGGADHADTSVHHVGGRYHIAARLGLHDGLLAKDGVGLVIQDAPLPHQTVMAIGIVRVERHVADDTEVRQLLLQPAHGAADEVIGIYRFVRARGLLIRLDIGKESQGWNAERLCFARSRDQAVDAVTHDAGHGINRRAGTFAVAQEHRPDQLVGRQYVLRHHSPHPGVAPVTPQAG